MEPIKPVVISALLRRDRKKTITVQWEASSSAVGHGGAVVITLAFRIREVKVRNSTQWQGVSEVSSVL
jgi:hypothetical protein